MARQVTATEVKAKLLSLLDDVEKGEEIEITRHGLTVARLAPARGRPALRGRFARLARSAASDEDLFSTGVTWELA
jgi:prevent-host-death family protein